MNSTKKKKNEPLSLRIRYGEFLPITVIFKYLPYIIVTVIFLLLYISGKFKEQKRMEEIIQLTRDLNNAKTEMTKASSQYNSSIREPQMIELIDSLHINLSIPNQPPYEI